MQLEMRGISKSFGAVRALENVTFSLAGGEICALLGENGAGKSTLMNILGGVLQPDAGEILIDGKRRRFASPAESLAAGIAFIHQELNLILDLPVYENMFLGRELRSRRGLLDLQEMRRRTAEAFSGLGMDLDPSLLVRELDASYKQIVEITRAIMMNAEIIIMDEPTTSLTDPEILRVFDICRTLSERGVGIVFISHKLREVKDFCSRYSVLRDGVMVAEGDVESVETDDLARFMVGHELTSGTKRMGGPSSGSALKAVNLGDGAHFRDISFEAHRGEVLGFTGLLGDGRSELFLSIFGAGENFTGQLFIDGEESAPASPTEAIGLGLAYLPRNRKENSIIRDMSILENASVVTWDLYAKLGFIDRGKENELFDRQAQGLRIKSGARTDLITSLSGGNQQKVVLGKWLSAEPQTLILDNPTQGVDVGAKEEIYEIIARLAAEGVAVIVLSSEAQEIIRLCDRACVMYHGRVMGEVAGERMNEHEIMRLATGSAEQEERI